MTLYVTQTPYAAPLVAAVIAYVRFHGRGGGGPTTT